MQCVVSETAIYDIVAFTTVDCVVSLVCTDTVVASEAVY